MARAMARALWPAARGLWPMARGAHRAIGPSGRRPSPGVCTRRLRGATVRGIEVLSVVRQGYPVAPDVCFLQNNLLYLSLSNLDAAIFQITCQV